VNAADAQRHLKLLANAIVHLDRDLKQMVLFHVCKSVQSDSQLVALLEVERYDESTLDVSRKDVLAKQDQAIAQRYDKCMGVVSLMHCEASSVVGRGNMRLPSKLMQRQSDWGIVVEFAAGRFVTLLGETHNWLQLMDRTTGECYRECDAKTNSRCSLEALRFSEITKSDCCDQASGIDRCERALARDDQQYKRLKARCELHITKIGNNKTFLLMEAHHPPHRWLFH
jgi:hypothetical protein